MKSFNLFSVIPDLPTALDASQTMYPTSLDGYVLREPGRRHFLGNGTSTYYVYVLSGRLAVSVDAPGGRDVLVVARDGFVSSPGPLLVEAAPGDQPAEGCRFFVIERGGFRGQRTYGRREVVGRLSYIDGCSDSLLVYPPRMGDPCLNHLHFPPGIVQTQHLHPSIRLGCVVAGEGRAFGPGWELPLKFGDCFLLDEQEIHSFRTDVAVPADHSDRCRGIRSELPEGCDIECDCPRETLSPMDVIAFHPDSDWGPVDANHPMLNRTYIKHGGGAR